MPYIALKGVTYVESVDMATWIRLDMSTTLVWV